MYRTIEQFPRHRAAIVKQLIPGGIAGKNAEHHSGRLFGIASFRSQMDSQGVPNPLESRLRLDTNSQALDA
jgi:hypothetical protein